MLPAVHCRLPAARAQKSETDLDFRSLLHSLVRDLLSVAHQPAWPAAAFLLLRFAALLQGERGLRHPDQHVRQYCIDLLASLAARLYADEGDAQRDAPQLQQLADEWVAVDGELMCGGAGGQKGSGHGLVAGRESLQGLPSPCRNWDPLILCFRALAPLQPPTHCRPSLAAVGPSGVMPASADLGEEAPRLLLLYLSVV